MAPAIKHAFTSAKADGTDATVVRPSNWNADHILDDKIITYAKIQDVSANDKLLGRQSGGVGPVEEIDCTAAGRALIDDANAAAQRTTLGLASVAASGSAADLTSGTLPDARMPALTGDVTTAVGTVATTIAANAVTTAKINNSQVTYAKIQNVTATDRLLGRSTAGAGVVEEIVCTSFGRALIDDASVAAQRTTLGLVAVANTGSAADLSAGTLLAARMPALTGDVTSVVNTVGTTIANNAVTYAKMQDVSATDKLLGRQTAGAGDPEEITCTAAGRALIDDAAAVNQRATLGLGMTLLNVQKITATGTYTPTSGTTAVRVTLVGSGGGGGSGTGVTGAAGSGGASGEWAVIFYKPGTAIAGGAVTVPAGGASDTAGGNASVVIDGLTFTAIGGTAGIVSAANASYGEASAVALASSGNTASDLYRGSSPSVAAMLSVAAGGTPTAFTAGIGGGTPFGSGGRGSSGDSVGNVGLGFGAGGGGGRRGAVTNRAGGAGAPAVVIIEEFQI